MNAQKDKPETESKTQETIREIMVELSKVKTMTENLKYNELTEINTHRDLVSSVKDAFVYAMILSEKETSPAS